MTSLNQRITSLENNSGTGTGTTTIADVENLQTTLDTKQETLTAGDNITIVDNVISSSGSGTGTTTIADVENLQTTLDSKQNQLTAGDNITIYGNIISSTGGGSSSSGFVGFKLTSSSYYIATINYGGSSSGKPTSDQIYTDAGTPFNWDETVYNSGGGTIASTSYTSTASGDKTFTYPYYQIPTAGYWEISYSFGTATTGGLVLKVWIVKETAPLTGEVILATSTDQPSYKEYNSTINYFNAGDKVWMKRGGWNYSTGTVNIEGQTPYGFFQGRYIGT